ncbi:hypothetical protein B0H10DRAFT_1939665 [Mycena sp. CBHHK59/15]|nr:hypothetical protein B0H10DRAFT_1939665 [Mycena sp. CBHHK59/15]
MAPRAPACDWTSDPGDKIALVTYFASIKDKIGQGESWDQTALEFAAMHMATRGPPLKGGPKNANSVKAEVCRSSLSICGAIWTMTPYTMYWTMEATIVTTHLACSRGSVGGGIGRNRVGRGRAYPDQSAAAL